VPDHVRVRQEDFGLLFYDTRSTRLTFVRSGDRLVPPPFTGDQRMLRVAAETGGDETEAGGGTDVTPGAAVDPGLSRLLDGLVAKGLLVPAQAE
jgi:hypothetical protein